MLLGFARRSRGCVYVCMDVWVQSRDCVGMCMGVCVHSPWDVHGCVRASPWSVYPWA